MVLTGQISFKPSFLRNFAVFFIASMTSCTMLGQTTPVALVPDVAAFSRQRVSILSVANVISVMRASSVASEKHRHCRPPVAKSFRAPAGSSEL